MKIAIRTDGSTSIGMGHVVNSLALADELKEYGFEIYFIMKDFPEAITIVREKGFTVRVLQDDMVRILEQEGTNVLITDLLEIPDDYSDELRKRNIKSVCVDILGNCKLESDLLFNRTIIEKRFEKYTQNVTRKYLGPKYITLRPEFAGMDVVLRQIHENVTSILLCFGGGDEFNVTGRVLRILDQLDVKVTAVLGPGFKGEINVTGMKNPPTIVRNAYNMKELLLQADVAITAGGSIQYELAITGTPALIIPLNDHQIENADGFVRRGSVMRTDVHSAVRDEEILQAVRKLLEDYSLRKHMSKAGKKITDGKGVQRMAKIIADFVQDPKVTLIGIDAATWDVIDPLMKEGLLPTFKKLTEGGVRAHLKSLKGYKSPALWNTIATGKMPEKHGILYFSNLFLDMPKYNVKKDLTTNPLVNWPTRIGNLFSKDTVEPSPFSKFMKKGYIYTMLKYGKLLEKWNLGGNYLTTSSFLQEKPIWEMLSDEKVSCGVVGWLVSWPASPVHGVLVSEKAVDGAQTIYRSKFSMEQPVSKITYPEEYRHQLTSCGKQSHEITDDEIDYFFCELGEEARNDIRSGEFDKNNHCKFFTQLYLSDVFSTNAGVHIKEHVQPDFLSVYLPGLDGVQHIFWNYHEPTAFPFITKTGMMYDDTVRKYYQFLDGQVAKLIEKGTVIIVSDHGMEAIAEKHYDATALRTGQHDDSPDGILIMNGPNIKQGHEVTATVLDIAPTILHLMGKPVDDAMDGKVLHDAFVHEVAVQMKKYEKRKPEQGSFYTKEEEKKVKERLKTLGYLD